MIFALPENISNPLCDTKTSRLKTQVKVEVKVKKNLKFPPFLFLNLNLNLNLLFSPLAGAGGFAYYGFTFLLKPA
ncbi:MAG: hypothetical protein A3K09_02925 [Nitrospinae bacterium RIFCSPLOWO2_12_FULL_47_7]|nr:MAG: hypothetical protein A3K09_02925 [Nitrospinae bacterium RIFCSPLOWO2_12_FULL_47_7]